MAEVRAEMCKRAIPGEWLCVDGRWSHPREAEWCTVSFIDPITRKIALVVTKWKAVEKVSSTALELRAFEDGLNQLRAMGFQVKGILSDDGGSFKTGIEGLGIAHQKDVWHKGRALAPKFIKDLIDAKRPAMKVAAATCTGDLWLCSRVVLFTWLKEHGTPKEGLSTTSGKADLIEGVCEKLGKFVYDPQAVPTSIWLYPELRRVLRVRENGTATRAPVAKRLKIVHGGAAEHTPLGCGEGNNAGNVEVPILVSNDENVQRHQLGVVSINVSGSDPLRISGHVPVEITNGVGSAPERASVGSAPERAGVERSRQGAVENLHGTMGVAHGVIDIGWNDAPELWEFDPHPIHGVPTTAEADYVRMTADTMVSQVDDDGILTDQDQTLDDEANHQDTADAEGLLDSQSTVPTVTPQTHESVAAPPRWTERVSGKRKRGALATDDEDDADYVEVSLAQRWGTHFNHVMLRNSTKAAAGHTPSASVVAQELATSADHWAGLHSKCGNGAVIPRCVSEKWGPENAVYEPNSSAHLALRKWLETHCSPKEMEAYVSGASNWVNESFHSLVIKYAPKRIRFQGSMVPRIGLSVLHWNHTVSRLVRAIKTRVRKRTRVRRGSKERVLEAMDCSWVDKIMSDWRDIGLEGDDSAQVDVPDDSDPQDSDAGFGSSCPGNADSDPPTQQPADADRPTQQPTDSDHPTRQPADSDHPTQQPAHSDHPTQQPAHSDRPTQQPADSASAQAVPPSTPLSLRKQSATAVTPNTPPNPPIPSSNPTPLVTLPLGPVVEGGPGPTTMVSTFADLFSVCAHT
ncbi:unnamed protein product [Closterium sp. Yama58-4]|nr:unnamed protein product [Closterium sp. Yama58-4]